MQRLPDIETAVRRSQQDCGRCDFLRLPEPLDGQTADLPGLPLGTQRVVEAGIDRAGRDRVDQYTVRCRLLRQRSREAKRRSLGGAIVREPGRALVGKVRADVDDAPITTRLHTYVGKLREQER